MAVAVVTRRGAPANETENQKLIRLANKRVNKAITQIRLIGNLGGYGPTEQQRNNIIKVIDAEIAKMKRNISSDAPVEEEGFKLA